MPEQHEKFPNGLEAFCLIVVLFFVEMIFSGLLDRSRIFSGIAWSDLSGLVAVAGNGVLFCALLAYKHLSYAALFHPARHSVLATVGTLGVPVLLRTDPPEVAHAVDDRGRVIRRLEHRKRPVEDCFGCVRL